MSSSFSTVSAGSDLLFRFVCLDLDLGEGSITSLQLLSFGNPKGVKFEIILFFIVKDIYYFNISEYIKY